jgi:hypothetical protein
VHAARDVLMSLARSVSRVRDREESATPSNAKHWTPHLSAYPTVSPCLQACSALVLWEVFCHPHALIGRPVRMRMRLLQIPPLC